MNEITNFSNVNENDKNEEEKKYSEIIYPINNINTKNVKVRNPGIDFIRMFVMFTIVLHHLTYFTCITRKFPKYIKIFNLIGIFTSLHNTTFAIVSGIVGIKTKVKYSNLFYIYFWTQFYSMSFYFIYKIYNPLLARDFQGIEEFFIVVFQKYWYFTQYFATFLFLPVINNGINKLSKSELKTVIFSIYFSLLFWNDYMNPTKDVFHFCGNKSIPGFIFLYLNGAYIGKYRREYEGMNKTIFCFLCISIYILTSLFTTIIINTNSFEMNSSHYKSIVFVKLKQIFVKKASALPMIIQANTMILFLLEIKYLL